MADASPCPVLGYALEADARGARRERVCATTSSSRRSDWSHRGGRATCGSRSTACSRCPTPWPPRGRAVVRRAARGGGAVARDGHRLAAAHGAAAPAGRPRPAGRLLQRQPGVRRGRAPRPWPRLSATRARWRSSGSWRSSERTRRNEHQRMSTLAGELGIEVRGLPDGPLRGCGHRRGRRGGGVAPLRCLRDAAVLLKGSRVARLEDVVEGTAATAPLPDARRRTSVLAERGDGIADAARTRRASSP